MVVTTSYTPIATTAPYTIGRQVVQSNTVRVEQVGPARVTSSRKLGSAELASGAAVVKSRGVDAPPQPFFSAPPYASVCLSRPLVVNRMYAPGDVVPSETHVALHEDASSPGAAIRIYFDGSVDVTCTRLDGSVITTQRHAGGSAQYRIRIVPWAGAPRPPQPDCSLLEVEADEVTPRVAFQGSFAEEAAPDPPAAVAASRRGPSAEEFVPMETCHEILRLAHDSYKRITSVYDSVQECMRRMELAGTADEAAAPPPLQLE